MEMKFLEHVPRIEDPRIARMNIYPLDEVLLTVLAGLLCRAEDSPHASIATTVGGSFSKKVIIPLWRNFLRNTGFSAASTPCH